MSYTKNNTELLLGIWSKYGDKSDVTVATGTVSPTLYQERYTFKRHVDAATIKRFYENAKEELFVKRPELFACSNGSGEVSFSFRKNFR